MGTIWQAGAGAVALGLLAAPVGAVWVRRGRRLLGALVASAVGGAAALAATAAGGEGALAGPAALAAATGALGAWLLTGVGVGTWRRGTFDAAFGRAAFAGGRAESALPARLASQAPSASVDAAERLRLERVVLEAEAKSEAELVVTAVASCGPYEGARWRWTAWGAVLGLAAAGALGLAPPAEAAAGVLGALAGRALARSAALRRLALPQEALAEAAADAAWDAFAHAGLVRTPGARGVLLFVALFEGRVLLMVDEGLDRLLEPGDGWQPEADAVARGADEEGLAEGLLRGLTQVAGRVAELAPGPGRAPGQGPPPVRIQD